jgi:hypothetical protein
MIDIEDRFPLVVFTFRGTITMPELERYLSESERLLERTQPYAGLVIAADVRPLEVALVRRQAQWMKVNRERVKQKSLGVALVIPSPMIRGVLKAILWLEPMPQPHKLCSNLEDAVSWVHEKLAAAKLPLPPYPPTAARI